MRVRVNKFGGIMKKLNKLLLLGLLVAGLSSCGVDNTRFEETDTGEEVTLETVYNKVLDIEKCLNFDIEACNRAEASEGGFTSSPFFFEDLLDADTIEFKGMTFTKVDVSDDETAVKFETKNTYDVAGSSRDMVLKQKLIIRDDFTVDTQASWKWQEGTIYFAWQHDNPSSGTSQWFIDLFKGIINETGIEWQSISRNNFWIDNNKAVVVKSEL